MDNFDKLIRAALTPNSHPCDGEGAIADTPPVSADLERRVMLEVARRAITKAHRRASFSLNMSIAGIAVTAAASVATLVLWFPTEINFSLDLDSAFHNLLSSLKSLLP